MIYFKYFKLADATKNKSIIKYAKKNWKNSEIFYFSKNKVLSTALATNNFHAKSINYF